MSDDRPPILIRNVLKAIAFFAIALVGLVSLGLCPSLVLADVVMSLMPSTARFDDVAKVIVVSFVTILSGYLLWHAVKIAKGE